jgi:hypothetical protein
VRFSARAPALPRPSSPSRVEEGDLPHREGLLVLQGQFDHGVGELPGVFAAGLVGEDRLGEPVFIEVLGVAFRQVIPERAGPACDMYWKRAGDQPPRSKPTSTRRSSPDRRPQFGQQPGSSMARRAPGLGHHHQDRVAVGVGDPRLHGGRGGEPQPGDVGLGDLLGALIRPDVPVDVEQQIRVPAVMAVLSGVPGGVWRPSLETVLSQLPVPRRKTVLRAAEQVPLRLAERTTSHSPQEDPELLPSTSSAPPRQRWRQRHETVLCARPVMVRRRPPHCSSSN